MAAPQPPPGPESDFLQAAFKGDLKLVKRLASEVGNGQGCEMVTDGGRRNALHYAAAGGKTRVCKFLVEKLKFNVKSKEIQGNTPLLCALICLQYPTAIYLIENGAAAIDCINPLRGHTALHLAAEQGHEEIMRLLLSKGVKVEHDLNVTLKSPLELACSHKTTACAQLLLDNGADPNSFLEMSSTPLLVSVAAKSYECMDLLLKAGADPNIGVMGRTPLQVAVFHPDVRIIKRLLNAGANANVVDPLLLMTPLEMAALRDDVAEVKILFPFTSRISSIPDWSVDGIMKHCRSKETATQLENRRKESFKLSKAKGREAFEKKDYENAVKWYFQASLADPTNAEMHSNQSLCWAKLNLPVRALDAAESCVKLKPDWFKAHYRMGAAHMLLNDSNAALKSFSRAFQLDPTNMDIKKAYGEALKAEYGWDNDLGPQIAAAK